MVRSGVPIHFRPLVWQCLAKVETSTAKQKYAEYMKMNSPCEKVIRRDISRTYPEHEFFKEKQGVGQERLFNVIKVRWGRHPFPPFMDQLKRVSTFLGLLIIRP